MERLEAKLVALFGMFLVIFLCMCLPVKVSALIKKQGDRAARILGLLRCFAGGVFLGTILLHMIPETHDQVQEFLLNRRGLSYPFAELCVVCGFFFICVFERIVLTIDGRNRSTTYLVRSEVMSSILNKVMDRAEGHINEAYSQQMDNLGPDAKNAPSPKTYLATNEVMVATHMDQEDGTPCALNQVMDNAVDRRISQTSGRSDSCTATVNSVDRPTVISAPATNAETDDDTKTRSIILILALSFECIFDGLSVSLQLTTKGVWDMFIAILSHEFIIAFCLGVELAKYYSTKKLVACAFAYAMMPPMGCVIGLIITEANLDIDIVSVELTSGLLIAFAAGIFLYCTFIGMLGEELIDDCTFEKILVTLVGCAIMTAMAAIPDPAGGEEDHGNNGMTTISPLEQ